MCSLPQTDAKLFQIITTNQQDQLMAHFTAAAATCERAATGASHKDKARACGRWGKYCQSAGCSNFYMGGLGKQEKIWLLPWLSDSDDSRGNAMGHWLREQSEVPSHMWYRRSGQRADRTQQKMQITKLASFYQDSFEPFKMKVPSKCSKKPYHFQSLMN